MLEIRPHHLLCTAGYKGQIYNPESANNWANTIANLKANPQIKLKITLNEDSLCKTCTHSQSNNGTCDRAFVQELDKKIKDFLKLKEDKVYKFKALKDKLFKMMTPQIHEDFCSNCGWWKKGLCHDTFEKKPL